ncbi:uncharacterized protein LOC124865319 [Girardinichthys multiradiatus]|uniref:uncharacterized protein LOC124865319 n=1 Tax=Girardinichthys multiradiatus TaxID=208333 RepID=UPI001FAC5DB2|nr:uncharacterized protein LOC124865319 [Girardinichthys multiradiatus]
MAMDPDQWEEQDDIYENGDTFGVDIGRREGLPVPGEVPVPANRAVLQTNQTANNLKPPRLPLPHRYMTIRWPPLNGNRGPGKKDQLALFRKITVGLVLLCMLLLGVLVGLSIVYYPLAGIHLKMTKEMQMLQEENQKLQKGNDNSWCKTIYRISSTGDSGFLSAKNLYVLNYEILEEHISNSSFFLFYTSMNNGSCQPNYKWHCTC